MIFQKLGTVVEKIIGENPNLSEFKKIQDNWQEIIGAGYKLVSPLKLENGILFIKAVDGLTREYLRRRKYEIIRKAGCQNIEVVSYLKQEPIKKRCFYNS